MTFQLLSVGLSAPFGAFPLLSLPFRSFLCLSVFTIIEMEGRSCMLPFLAAKKRDAFPHAPTIKMEHAPHSRSKKIECALLSFSQKS